MRLYRVQWFLLALCAFLLLLTFLPRPADAQQVLPVRCGPVAELEGQLRKKYGQSPVWVGSSQKGVAYFVVQSADGKTWSWYMRKDEVACMIASGVNGQPVDGAKPQTF